VTAATVVFADDGSEDAQHAIAVAGELLGAHRALFVHVRLLPVPQIVAAGEDEESYTAFEQAQQREVDRISAEGVEAAARAGSEAEAVVAAADSVAGVRGVRAVCKATSPARSHAYRRATDTRRRKRSRRWPTARGRRSTRSSEIHTTRAASSRPHRPSGAGACCSWSRRTTA
jgi:hypothetical protein